MSFYVYIHDIGSAALDLAILKALGMIKAYFWRVRAWMWVIVGIYWQQWPGITELGLLILSRARPGL